MLNRCSLCGASAIEQVRGKLVEGDPGWVQSRSPEGDLLSPAQQGSNTPANSGDTRVICSACDNSTGWKGQDVADYMRFVWNRDNTPKTEDA